MTDNIDSINENIITPEQVSDPAPESVKKENRFTSFCEKLGNTRFGKWCYKNRLYLGAFFLPVFIMYVVYSVFGVHPYGDLSVLVLDLNGQYVSYYEMLRDAIWGDGSLIYNWSRNLSGETMGMFGYYLASPFMWIIVLLPRTMMCGSIEIMELAKVGCCGLAMAYYLTNRKNAGKLSALLFSVCYALMTYIVVELMNPMWIDGMIWLPMTLLGIERLVDEGKMLPVILPMTIMFISHFYIGYMTAFFSIIYFIYYVFSRPGHIIAPHWFKGGLKFAISGIVSALSSCIVIIPVYCSLRLGKLSFSEPDFSPETQFDIFQFLSKLFQNSYDTVRPEGLPMIACGTVVLLLVPLFFLNNKISPKEKISLGLLMLAVFGSMYVSTVDIAWHGFQVPNWLPYRYSYTFSFIMIIMAFRAFENLEGVSFKELCLTAFAWVCVLVLISREEYEHMYTFETVWYNILAIAVIAAVLYLYKKTPDKVMSIILVGLVCVDIFVNSIYTIYAIDYDVVYSKYSSYQDYFIDGREVVSQVEELDEGKFRMEKTFHRTVNDPIGMGFAGISHSSSTMNTPVLKMLKTLGYGMQGHYTKYTGQTLVTDALFGIKYLMYKPDKITPSVDPRELTRQEIQNEIKKPYKTYTEFLTPEDTGVADITVYQNPYALSIGYMADYDILECELDSNDPIKNQQQLLKSLTGEGAVRVFKRIYQSATHTANCTTSTTGDHIMYTTTVDGKDSYVEFTIDIDNDNPVYAFFPTIYQRKCNIWVKSSEWDIVNYAFVDYFFTGEHYSVLNLGSFQEGETVKVRMTLANGEAIFSDVLFYYLDMEEFEEIHSQISDEQWNITEHTDTYLYGTVDAKQDGILFTTIPYEPGWTVKVDGNEVETLTCLDSLIGIELSAGEHTVEMSFWPTYLTLAIIVELIGLSFIAIIAIIEVKDGAILKKIIAKTK